MKKSLLKIKSKIYLITLVTLFATYSNSQCTILNQPPNPNTTNNNGTYDYVQSFTAPCSGDMQYFELTSTESGTFPGATLEVYNGNVPSGTAIYTQPYPNIVISNPGDPITIDITGTLPLVSGNQYSFRFSATDLNFHYTTGSTYSGGHAWQNGSALTTTDFYFEILIGSCSATTITPDVASLSPVSNECEVQSFTAPTATNDCGTVVSGVPDITFPITTQGTTQITWSYDDGDGNTTSQTQDIIIDDVTAPVADVASLPLITEECSASPSAPTATDNCAGVITGTPDLTLPITTQGTFTITWTYDDGNGNTSTQIQDVIVSDGTAPVADVASLPQVTECFSATPSAPTATDNCSGVLTGTPDVSFPITTAGTTLVTWTYDDGNGNTSTQTQNVIVNMVDVNVTQNGGTLSADASNATYQWLDCDDSYAVISGETNQMFSPTTIGNYAVEVTENGCTDTSTCFIYDDTGLELLEGFESKIYPNPSTGQFTVESNSQLKKVTVYDIRGRIVFESNQIQGSQINVDLKGEQPGVYYILLSTSFGNVSKKIVLQN